MERRSAQAAEVRPRPPDYCSPQPFLDSIANWQPELGLSKDAPSRLGKAYQLALSRALPFPPSPGYAQIGGQGGEMAGKPAREGTIPCGWAFGRSCASFSREQPHEQSPHNSSDTQVSPERRVVWGSSWEATRQPEGSRQGCGRPAS